MIYATTQHALTVSIEVLAILPIVVMMIDFLLFLNSKVPAMSVATVPAVTVPASVEVGASEPGLGSMFELFADVAKFDSDYGSIVSGSDIPLPVVDLDRSKLTKAQLLDACRVRSIKISSKASKAAILAALAA